MSNKTESAFPEPSALGEKGLTKREYYAAHAPITWELAVSQWYADNRGKPKGAGSPTVGEVMTIMAALRGAYANAMVEVLNEQD